MQQFPQARLLIAGDGSAHAELEQQAVRKGGTHQVDFLGWVEPEDVPSLINASTLVLMPSRQESLPLVALEAALMARPVIATRTGGLPEVVVYKQTGLLVEPEDAQALADAVTFLLRRPELAMSMGKTQGFGPSKCSVGRIMWMVTIRSTENLRQKYPSWEAVPLS